MIDIKCCICGVQLEQSTMDYYCEACNEKYGDYYNDEPLVQPMRKRSRYDDEKR